MGVDSVSILVCLSNRYVGLYFFVDVPAFRRMMYFVIVTYTITVLIYLFFPTCQNLRPEAFVRNNLLTRFIELFYSFDTNTNVCPSLHVIGSVAAMFGLWDCKALQSVGWKSLLHQSPCVSVSPPFYETAFYHGCSRCIASLFLWLVDCL